MPKADIVVKVYPDTHKRLISAQQAMTDRRRPPPPLDQVISELLAHWEATARLLQDVKESGR